MRTRCKFRCDKVARMAWPAEEVTLSAVYGGTQENESFAEATPSGTMTFMVTNPAVIGKFEPGREYYIDIQPAEA